MATEAAPTSWAQVAQRARRPAAEPSPWLLMERFMADLDGVEGPDRQSKILLDTILELTGAEAVALVPMRPGDPFTTSGARRLDEEQARAIVEVVESGPVSESQYGSQNLTPSVLANLFRGSAVPTPTDLVVIRVGNSRPSWLIALTVSSGRLLNPGAGGIARLAVRALRSRQRAARSSVDLTEALFGIVQGFAAAMDAKDPYTYGHSERVARMASRIGREMKLPQGTVSELYLAGLLHDIGKIGVPEAVLCKPGKLTPEEFVLMQAHPVIGDRILAGIRQLAPVRPGVRSHHEWWNGLGYPDRLSGNAIPLLGRVLAVADTCDAMLSVRHYRPPHDPEEVEQEMVKGRGIQWDPLVVDGFMACREEIYAIRQVGLGASVHAAVNHAVEAAGSDR